MQLSLLFLSRNLFALTAALKEEEVEEEEQEEEEEEDGGENDSDDARRGFLFLHDKKVPLVVVQEREEGEG